MSDVERYIKKRKQVDVEFAEDFELGYSNFKVGVLLAQAREAAGITQEELASRLNLDISIIVNIENNVENVGILTLEKYAEALGKRLFVEIK
ncbi:MAG: helix-turn-helix transcriptional regulator [Methylacidiphilales bacterium]|nr:helix-turn-helix transcriptional regulator [Candidatus Methylacidiphilales bacterium]NJR17141.1 helix-turn-helix transcriptional regulator [Calothrix sp. CSU_2_0]